MQDADDPIPVPTPEDTIFLSDAFVVVYRALTPDWQLLEERLNGAGQNQHVKDHAYRDAERGQRRANEWLRERMLRETMSQGALRALVRDPGDPHSSPPRPPQTFQLSRRGWSSMSSFETGFDADHVGPGDLLQSGPNTVIGGARRPVFFDRKEFENVLSEIAQPTSRVDAPCETPPVKNKGGRPPDYKWDQYIKPFFLQTIGALGKPGPNNERLPSRTQLIEVILKYCAEKDLHPAHSTVRDHIYQWLAEIDGNLTET